MARSMWKRAFTPYFIHQPQRNAGILSMRKDAVPGAEGRHPAKDVKVVMDENIEKVRRSKLCARQTTSDLARLSREALCEQDNAVTPRPDDRFLWP